MSPEGEAPASREPAVPVESTIDTAAGIEVAEERALRLTPHWRRRRFLATTTAYLALWIATILFVHADQGLFTPLVLLVPLYLITLRYVLRTPKSLKRLKRRRTLGELLGWQGRLMTSIAVFLALYLPFAFFTDEIIPYAPIVEYALFTLAILVLVRLAGRSLGVAPSLDALPPPSHRLHQQVVAPLDDAHYQRTLWLNYNFVEKGKGQRHLAKRLETLLSTNGVNTTRQADILAPLERYEEPFVLGLTRAGRARRRVAREQRSGVLQRVFDRINHELETTA